MRGSGLVGSWSWGISAWESFRIGTTWDGELGVWSTGQHGEAIFGILHPAGIWHRTELFFDGQKNGKIMKFRLTSPGTLSCSLKHPNQPRTVELTAQKSAPPSRPTALVRSFEHVELELDLVRLGGLGIRAWHRPAGAPRAPFGVVICPGVPLLTLGLYNFHSCCRLVTELETTLAEMHVPVVCFDYEGQSSSSVPVQGSRADTSRWQMPSFTQATKDAETVLDWAKEHVSNSLVFVGFSWGCASALRVALAKHVEALVFISAGCLLPWLLPEESQKEMIPWTLHQHASLSCKALYVCGDEDSFTPAAEVRRLVSARGDGGADVDVEVVRSKDHDLRGCEEDVASICTDWILTLQEEIGSLASQTVHVLCQQCSHRRSVGNVFHAELPTGAAVRDLRKALGAGLPASAKVFDAEDHRVLQDADLVPPRVNVSQFAGEITSAMVLTKDQCRRAQELIKAAAEEPEMQKRLDELQKKSGGNEGKYRLALANLLLGEVFSDVAQHFHLPPTTEGMQSILGAIEAHGQGDAEMLRRWLEVETLWRNQAQIVKAKRKIAGLEQKMAAAVGVA